MQYHFLVFVILFSAVYCEWLYTTFCGNPDLSGFAINGNCVALNSQQDSFRYIQCLDGVKAVEYNCTDPLCANCEKVDTYNINDCYKSGIFDLLTRCFNEEPNFNKLARPNHTVIKHFVPKANCGSEPLHAEVYPTNFCFAGQSAYTSIQCSKTAFYAVSYFDNDCERKSDEILLPLNKCQNGTYIECFGKIGTEF